MAKLYRVGITYEGLVYASSEAEAERSAIDDLDRGGVSLVFHTEEIDPARTDEQLTSLERASVPLVAYELHDQSLKGVAASTWAAAVMEQRA